MVERTRRLRMGLAHSPPGASGVTARPNYVGPSGNGLVKRRNAGAKNPAELRSLAIAAPSVFRRRSRGLRKNAAVERREVNALRHWACAARRIDVTRAFRRSAPLTFVRELSPCERGDGNARRSPRLARTGAAELWLFESPIVWAV